MSEKDCMLLKEMKPLVLDRLCAHVLQKVALQCDSSTETNLQRFTNARALIESVNHDIAQVFDDMTPSTAMGRLRSLVSQELITEAELAQFGDETRNSVWWIE